MLIIHPSPVNLSFRGRPDVCDRILNGKGTQDRYRAELEYNLSMPSGLFLYVD